MLVTVNAFYENVSRIRQIVPLVRRSYKNREFNDGQIINILTNYVKKHSDPLPLLK